MGSKLRGPSRGLLTLGLIVALANVSGAAAVRAQVAVQARDDSPPSRTSPAFRPLGDVPVLRAPPIAASILAYQAASAEAAGDGSSSGRPYRFADPFAVEATPATHGRWETTADGETAVWRLRAASAGSVSLNLGFTRYLMPPGGRLWVYTVRDGEEEEVVGPFTEADNEAHGELWTPILEGGEVVIEVAVPAGSRRELDLRLGSVNRGFRDLPPEGIGSGSHASCHIDVACSAANSYRDQVRSVGLLQLSGGASCTGVLLNSASGAPRPFLATAEHCMEGRNASRTVVYWNYESAECGDRRGGSRAHFQTGASLRAAHAGSDFALLELDDPPRTEHNVYLAGWRRDGAAPTSAVGIHHPRGHVKSISVENAPLSKIAAAGLDLFRILDWDRGATELGSSGSPLFDEDKRVVGVLSRGGLGCITGARQDYYGRLGVAWSGGGTKETRLSDWLDPDGTGATTLDGRDWNNSPESAEPLHAVALRLQDGARSHDVSHAFGDPEGDALTYAASSGDEQVVAAVVSGSAVVLTPVAAGSTTVAVSATDVDGSNTAFERTLDVEVGANGSPAPVGVLAARELKVGRPAVSVEVGSAFQDPDGDTLTYAAKSSRPDLATATLTGSTVTLGAVRAGVARISVTATDAGGSGTTAIQQFDFTVLPNEPPSPKGTLPDVWMNEHPAGRTVDVSGAFEDPEDDALTYGVTSSRTRVVTATLLNASVKLIPRGTGLAGTGSSTVTVTATDAGGSNTAAVQRFGVFVRNDSPETVGTIAAPLLQVGDGARTLDVSGAFSDPDGDALSYAARTDEPGVVGTGLSGATLSLSPKSRGDATVTVTATDAGGSNRQATQTFDVRVKGAR
ncbi:MAG: trypsin-like peptidase domain-containing protein, partial [Acidobacteriota bacterium]|nr:trypsin-like peptidase domain-containing protein [Acidobacteriota bacterium]